MQTGKIYFLIYFSISCIRYEALSACSTFKNEYVHTYKKRKKLVYTYIYHSTEIWIFCKTIPPPVLQHHNQWASCMEIYTYLGSVFLVRYI